MERVDVDQRGELHFELTDRVRVGHLDGIGDTLRSLGRFRGDPGHSALSLFALQRRGAVAIGVRGIDAVIAALPRRGQRR